jgi:hypothetical protein
LSLHPCVTAPWKIFNQHLSPMQPLFALDEYFDRTRSR